MGLAVGWSCAVLAFGKKGWRKSLPHSLGMQQPTTHHIAAPKAPANVRSVSAGLTRLADTAYVSGRVCSHVCVCLCPAAMIQQPRVPPTGQRQAIEVHIKWKEVLDYKREYLRMLSIGTGWPVDKLDRVSTTDIQTLICCSEHGSTKGRAMRGCLRSVGHM